MSGDVPHIASSNYASTTHSLMNYGAKGTLDGLQGIGATSSFDIAVQADARRVGQDLKRIMFRQSQPQEEDTDMAAEAKPTTRFVRVIIVDPNENLSLDDRLVYMGDEKFTDSNDQELFFEIDIKTVLASHNEKRIKVIDKKVKERTEYLEPAKIRDLKMVVVNIASF